MCGGTIEGWPGSRVQPRPVWNGEEEAAENSTNASPARLPCQHGVLDAVARRRRGQCRCGLSPQAHSPMSPQAGVDSGFPDQGCSTASTPQNRHHHQNRGQPATAKRTLGLVKWPSQWGLGQRRTSGKWSHPHEWWHEGSEPGPGRTGPAGTSRVPQPVLVLIDNLCQLK